MNGPTLMKSVARVMIVASLIAPLQGCLIPGNVRMDSASLGDALSKFMPSGLGKSSNGKKDWPFIPTENEKRMSEYSAGVMSQAMTGRAVRASYPESQKAFVAKRHAEFNAFMASAPQMSQWTAAQATEYSNYLSDLIPVADAIIAADEQKGANSDVAMKQAIVANKG
ncbi:MAG: hypothetical protein RSD49_14685, partial [Hafnia sp.]